MLKKIRKWATEVERVSKKDVVNPCNDANFHYNMGALCTVRDLLTLITEIEESAPAWSAHARDCAGCEGPVYSHNAKECERCRGEV